MSVIRQILVFLVLLAVFTNLQTLAGMVLMPLVADAVVPASGASLLIGVAMVVLAAALPGAALAFFRDRVRPYRAAVAAAYLLSTLMVAAGARPLGPALFCLFIYTLLFLGGATFVAGSRQALARRSRPAQG